MTKKDHYFKKTYKDYLYLAGNEPERCPWRALWGQRSATLTWNPVVTSIPGVMQSSGHKRVNVPFVTGENFQKSICPSIMVSEAWCPLKPCEALWDPPWNLWGPHRPFASQSLSNPQKGWRDVHTDMWSIDVQTDGNSPCPTGYCPL